MKLRIKGNSLRLRISQSEMTALLRDGCVAETVRFGAGDDAKLTYALAIAEGGEDIRMEYRAQTVTVVLSAAVARRWCYGDEIGIYGDAEVAEDRVALLVEKDFACLDGNDPQDADAFPNPNAGVAC